MSDIINIVDRYIAMWNETDPARWRPIAHKSCVGAADRKSY